MVIKTGRRMSSLDLGNGSSDASEELAAASDSSDHTNSNNRSILDQQEHQPSYVIPVDYSFGNTPPSSVPTHHSQAGIGTNSQNSHG